MRTRSDAAIFLKQKADCINALLKHFQKLPRAFLSSCLTCHAALWLTQLQPHGHACNSQGHRILWPLHRPPPLPGLGCFCFLPGETYTLQNYSKISWGHHFKCSITPGRPDMSLSEKVKRRQGWGGGRNANETARSIIFEFQTQ